MTVAAVLRQKGSAVVGVPPDATVAEAAGIIAHHRIGAVVVREPDGRLVGILSERDVVRGLTIHGHALMGLRVSALMTQNVQVIAPEATVDEAMELMDAGYFRHLPVVSRDGMLCGIVSIRDLVRHRITVQQSDVESLQAYVMGRGYALGRIERSTV
ncbi:MAG: CBS domain-containing protein [Acetobacteraceae bacterium]|nr:CBS domain-containing protein [Acetobacteraceae bacterium]